MEKKEENIKPNSVIELLNKIQQTIKVPKSIHNEYADFNYRNVELILEAVKPLLGDGVVVLTDKLIELGGRVYVEGTAKLILGDESIIATGYAREELERKKMSDGQLTGSASTYARKYALSGLLGLDDSKDPDDGIEDASNPKKKLSDEEFTDYMDNDWKTILADRNKYEFTSEQKEILNTEYVKFKSNQQPKN